jgi:hypothetical protein
VQPSQGLSVGLAILLVIVAAGVGVVGGTSYWAELRTPGTGGPTALVLGLSPSSSSVFSVDLSITPGQIDEGQSILVSASASGGDPSPSYTYQYYDMPSGCSTDEAQHFSCMPSSTGSYDIYVNVTDGAGNGTNSATTALTVDSSVMATLSLDHSSINLGQSVSITASASGGSGSYSYNYAGLPSNCMGQQGPHFDCTPSSTGGYSISVNVTDTNGGYAVSSNGNLQVNPSSSGGGGGGGSGNNSSNPFGSLLSGFSGIFSLFIIVGIIGFVTWILLIVGVWIIAVVLIRRLPKRGTAPAALMAGQTSKCASCSAMIPAGSKFCPECGTGTAPQSK